MLELTDGGVEYSFEAIGLKITAEQSFAMLRNGGTATIIGMIPRGNGSSSPAPSSWMRRRSRAPTWGPTASASTCRVRRSLPHGRLKLDQLVSRRITLDEVNDGFEAMRRGEVARSVIVVEPRE